MKSLVLLAAFCATLALVACNSSNDPGSSEATRTNPLDRSTEAAQSDSNLVKKAVAKPSRPPKIHVPPGPPPKNLVVKDLKEGYGAVAKWGQRLSVQHVGVNYKTGKTFEVFWGKTGPFSFNFGSGEVRDGWETGLKGMKVGGRRELILPSRLAYGTGALIYVVELLAIE